MYLEIRCPKCLELAQKEQVDMTALKAKCGNCAIQYDFSFDINQRLRKKGEVFQPEGFSTMKTSTELEIKIPFETNEPSSGIVPIKLIMKVKQFQLGCLVIFLSIFGLFFLFGVWDQFQYDKSWGAYWNLLGGLIFPVIIYFVGKRLFIKPTSIIKLNEKLLKIKIAEPFNGDNDNQNKKPTKPLRFELKAEEIKQVFVNEIRMTLTAYEVIFLDKTGKQHNPFIPFFNLDHALYVEQEIENFLNITDERVEDEVRL